MVIHERYLDRSSISVSKYMEEVRKYPLLSTEETIELATRSREGDEVASEKLVNANLRFVITVAKQYQNYKYDVMDLINEGNIGLYNATKVFDPTQGFKFSSYAIWHIKGRILDFIKSNSETVHVPKKRSNLIGKFKKLVDELYTKLERTPTFDEIERYCKDDFRGNQLNELYELYMTGVTSMNQQITFHDDDFTLENVLESEEYDIFNRGIQSDYNKEMFEKVLSKMRLQDVNIIVDTYGLRDKTPLTENEMCDKYSLTKTRIQQLIHRSVRVFKFNYFKVLNQNKDI